jgi:hypothetical protein
MKIRPKPRRYNDDELDESYFAARSNEDVVSKDGSNRTKASSSDFE